MNQFNTPCNGNKEQLWSSKLCNHYEKIVSFAEQNLPKIKVAVVYPVTPDAILSIAECVDNGFVDPVLVGCKDLIIKASVQAERDITTWDIIDQPNAVLSAVKAVQMASMGQVDALMKGSLHTDELLSAVVAKESGLRTPRRISHAYIMDTAQYHKPFIITDAAVNIAPTLADKMDICQNAIDLWQCLFGGHDHNQPLKGHLHELERPKVAILSAVETVNSRIPSTIDAAALCKMADRGQIYNAILDGPLAFDNAMSVDAARLKGIISPVAGDTDILVVPNLETGNALAKQLTFLGHSCAAGIILGAKVPIILTSRADSVKTRILSCIVAMYLVKSTKEA